MNAPIPNEYMAYSIDHWVFGIDARDLRLDDIGETLVRYDAERGDLSFYEITDICFRKAMGVVVNSGALTWTFKPDDRVLIRLDRDRYPEGRIYR